MLVKKIWKLNKQEEVEEKPSARKRRGFAKHGSMQPFGSTSLPGSAKKDDSIQQKKRALFGLTGSSDEQPPPRRPTAARSQISPDDGNRGIGTTFDKDNTNSSIGQMHKQESVVDASPIGVIETSNSRRVARRKTPSVGGNSLPRPQHRAKTADPSMRQTQNTDDRFNRNVMSPPHFDSRPDTGPGRKPPRPAGQPQVSLINKDQDDDDDEFDRDDDDQDIMALMDAPDTREAKSSFSVTPKKQPQARQIDQDEEDDDSEDIFSGGGYVPSTMTKDKAEDTKSKGKAEYGAKSDISNEATPISRRGRPLNAGLRQKGSRDSFSPPEIAEGNYMSGTAQQRSEK